MVEAALSEQSPVTIALAVVAIGAVVTALRAVFGLRESLRREFEEKFVPKEVLTVKLDAMKTSIGHVHECIHRIEDKMDEVIDRNRRKDKDDE